MAYGRTADAHAFMARSGNHSTKGSRRGFVDVETGVDPASDLTWEQQRDNLVKHKDACIRAMRETVGAERARLGLDVQRIDARLRELKLARPERRHTFESAFYHVAVRTLPQGMIDRLAREAQRMIAALPPQPPTGEQTP